MHNFLATEESAEMVGMARVNEDRHLPIDQIGIAIVFVRILPQVSVEVFFDFHKIPFIWLIKSFKN